MRTADPPASTVLGAPLPRELQIAQAAALALALAAALWLASRYNYLLFHSLVEIFSIVVACAVLMIAWSSRASPDARPFLVHATVGGGARHTGAGYAVVCRPRPASADGVFFAGVLPAGQARRRGGALHLRMCFVEGLGVTSFKLPREPAPVP